MTMMKIFLLSLLVVLSSCQTAEQDLVDPASIGYPSNVNFQIYSGYLDIWGNKSQLVHYVLLTSQNKPETDPLLFWTNGGPGCSSLLGWVQENGPFLFTGTNTTFQPNLENSWNRMANVLYFENPPGVGYSIQNITFYNYSDINSGIANFRTLQAFYQRFPDFVGRDFWLSGESYAGMYIPFMLEEIRQNNLNVANGTVAVPVKGFLIGNNVFVMSENMLNEYLTNTYASHQFLDDQGRQTYYASCFGSPNSAKCKSVSNILSNVQQNTDPYNIYGYTYGYQKPRSVKSTLGHPKLKLPVVSKQAHALYLTLGKTTEEIAELIRLEQEKEDAPNTCNEVPLSPDDVMIQYFTSAPIMKALNVYDTLSTYKNISNFKWTPCNNKVNLLFQRANDSTHLYPNFLKSGYQILIYSGNTDAVVPFPYTRASINDLFNNFGVNVTQAQNWTLMAPLPNQQLGGWYESWQNNDLNKGAPQNNFTYAVIRAAGHEVPEYQPVAAYAMLTNFMNGQPL